MINFCVTCNKPVPPNEANAYQNRHEDCFINNWRKPYYLRNQKNYLIQLSEQKVVSLNRFRLRSLSTEDTDVSCS